MWIDTRLYVFKKENNNWKENLIPVLNKEIVSEKEILNNYKDYLDEKKTAYEVEKAFLKTILDKKWLLINNDPYFTIKNMPKEDVSQLIKEWLFNIGVNSLIELVNEQIQNKKNYVQSIIKKSKFFNTEFNSNQQNDPNNIIEAVNNKFEIATKENTPYDLQKAWLINFWDESYHVPIVVNVYDLVVSKTRQYDRIENHYIQLFHELKNEVDEINEIEDLKNYFTVINFF